MRRRLCILSVLVLMLCVTVTATSAYYVRRDTAVNVVTAGNIRIALRGGKVGKILPVVPGAVVKQSPRVENTGDHPAFVRIHVERGLRSDIGGESAGLMELDFDTTHWIYRDGYYYYSDVLEPGETTQPLYHSLRFSPKIDNRWEGSTAKLNLLVYATQTEHNGTDPLKAAGWPAAK